MSATPIRNDGANVVERLFEDAIAEEISLLEAIEAGIIYPPKYVVPDFIREDELESLLEKINSVEGERKEQLKAEYDELVKKSDQTKGIPDLLSEHITEQDGKYIIFCRSIEDMQEKMSKAQEWFGKIDEEPEIYGIHSKDKTSSQQLQSFNNSDSKHLKLMYCVGMIDEGVHLNDVSGVILAAKTGSRPTYLQRIGRAISSGKDKKQALVIDLVNNNEILTDEHNTQYGYEISDLEALERLADWIENKNDGKWPEYGEDKSIKERAMAKRLSRINNKYLKYVENPNLLEESSENSIDEIQEIIQLGKTIGLFENIITIDLRDGSSNGIDVSINNFLRGVEIKGIRRDFREILDHDYFNININMKNFEEYKAWCEEHGKLPRREVRENCKRVKATKDREKETEGQREQRLGEARSVFFRKEKLTEEEEKIKKLYEELDEQYKEKSEILQNYEEYKVWCEKYGKLPRQEVKENGKIVKAAKDGEEETEEQKEQRLGKSRKNFYARIKRKNERKDILTEEEEEIKRLYEELDEQYKGKSKGKSINVLNLEEYKKWCKKYEKLPRTSITINGVRVESVQEGEQETEEQIEQRLGLARKGFFGKIQKKDKLTEEEEEIKRLYKELDKQYSVDMKNYKEYEEWCKQKGRLPKGLIKIDGIIVRTAKDRGCETEEQIEIRLYQTRQTFGDRIRRKDERKDILTEEEKEIKKLYEELDEQYKEKSVNMKNYEKYKEWCEKHGKLPRTGIKGVKTAQEGEKETEEQRELRLGSARRGFFKRIQKNDKLTEEEEEIKRLYEELDELYGKKQPARNIAPAVRNVSIGESQEANEFIEFITAEKTKEGASHNDE